MIKKLQNTKRNTNQVKQILVPIFRSALLFKEIQFKISKQPEFQIPCIIYNEIFSLPLRTSLRKLPNTNLQYNYKKLYRYNFSKESSSIYASKGLQTFTMTD